MSETYTYYFSGLVLPERADVKFPLPVRVLSPGIGRLPGGWEVSISVVKSQLSATVTSPTAENDVEGMHEVVEELSRYCVDAIGYLVACGYDVEITQVVNPTVGLHQVFGVDVPGVVPPERRSNEEVFARFQQILGTPLVKQQALRRALVDFREAIRSREDTAFFCFRAIEDLRQFFVGPTDDDVKKTWNEMAARINPPEETTAYIRDVLRSYAIPVRHGSARQVSREERAEMLRHTWIAIDAFINADLGGA